MNTRKEQIDRIHNILLNDARCWTQDENGDDIVSFDGQAEALVDSNIGSKERFFTPIRRGNVFKIEPIRYV